MGTFEFFKKFRHIFTNIFREYIDDTWIKSEYILCTLKYDNKRKTLLVYPDFTKFTAYKFTIDNDMTKTYEYAMENTSKFPNSDLLEKQRKILNKVLFVRPSYMLKY